jgi:hypothetical protein
MRNFLLDNENQGIARPACGREQEIVNIDAEIAENIHFWMETDSC